MKGTIIVDQANGNIISFSTRSCTENERWKTTVMPSLGSEQDDDDMTTTDAKVNRNFKTTQILDLHNSRYLIELNPTIGSQLPNLQRLLLTRCDRLQRLPDSIGSLQFLEEVRTQISLAFPIIFLDDLSSYNSSS
jgi:hypothetical protein